jgi:hypothetical protein
MGIADVECIGEDDEGVRRRKIGYMLDRRRGVDLIKECVAARKEVFEVLIKLIVCTA